MNESLVSVVAPLEGDTPDVVQAFVEETVAVLRGVVTHYEIILVDDGVGEGTVARVRSLLEGHDFVRFLRLSRHFGEETAITAGLDAAIGDYVIVMFPNMDPPALIPEARASIRSPACSAVGGSGTASMRPSAPTRRAGLSPKATITGAERGGAGAFSCASAGGSGAADR